MKRLGILAALAASLVILLGSCATTSYQKMAHDGGYDDFPLGAGKYQVVAQGNGFTSVERVRNIAFLRAAELTRSLGMKGFYILDDQGKTSHEISIDSNSFGTNRYDVRKHEFQIIIEPTNNDDAIDAQATFLRYRLEFGR